MKKNDQFDLVVIGAGTGALGVARACAQGGVESRDRGLPALWRHVRAARL